jgi:hypothetical protein
MTPEQMDEYWLRLVALVAEGYRLDVAGMLVAAEWAADRALRVGSP